MYNMYLETYFDQCMALLGNKHDPVNSFLERYNYEDWFRNGELADTTK